MATKSIKKLIRPQKGRMIGGVCASIANYFEIDVTLVRIAWVILHPAGILVYLICWVVIPSEE